MIHEFWLQPIDHPPLGCGPLTFGDLKGIGGLAFLSDRPDNEAEPYPMPLEVVAAIRRHHKHGIRTAGPTTYTRKCITGDVRTLLAGLEIEDLG